MLWLAFLGWGVGGGGGGAWASAGPTRGGLYPVPGIDLEALGEV